MLLAATLLAGCASAITTQVTRFNQWPASVAGSSFSFVRPPQAGAELEQATYESHVQAELEKLGLRRAPPGQPGRIQAEVQVGQRSDELSYLVPVYQNHPVFVPPYRDAAGRLYPGIWTSDPFGPRYVGERQVQRTVQISSLQLRLLDTAQGPPGKPPAVFESRARLEVAGDQLPLVVPYLVRAVFDDFPGQNGQVRTVEFDSQTGALLKK